MSDSGDKENWELKTLGEIAEIFSGSEITVNQKNTGDFPAIKSGDISELKGICFKSCGTFIDLKLLKHRKTFSYGDIVMVSQSGSRDVVGRSFLYLGEKDCIAGSGIYVIKHEQNPKYLAHVLNTEYVQQQINISISQKYSRGMPARLSRKGIEELQIPLPPRHIQDKIADFLDQLLSLKEELKERIKQYQYYRDLLIVGREEEGKRKGNLYHTQTIGEIAIDVYSGSEVTKAQLKEHGFPAIRYCEIHSSNLFIKECKNFVNIEAIKRKRYIEYGDLLIVNVSENLEDSGKTVVYLNENKCLAGNHVIIIKHKQNPRYLAYVTATDFYKKQVKEYSKKGIVCDLAITKIKQIKIPLPFPEKQEKIVSILDKFHELCGEITTGIPAMIEGTEKQYQYYRDKIIT